MLARAILLLLTTASLVLAQWGVPTVDTLYATDESGLWASSQAIALDDDGTLHAVWIRISLPEIVRYVLYSFKAPDQAWQVPTVIADSVSTTAIAVDHAAGEILVALDRRDKLMVLRKHENAWLMEYESESGDYYSTALTVSGTGVWHLASIAHDDPNDLLKIYYANQDSELGLIEESNPGIAGFNANPSIAVAPDHTVHIAYCGGTLADYHAHNLSSAPMWENWTDEIILAENTSDFTADVAVLSNGCAVWCISGNNGPGTPDRVFLCACGDGCQEISHARAAAAVMAIDPNDEMHFISSETDSFGFTGNLLATDWDWDYWRTEPIFGPAASSPSFVIDEEGYGHALCLQHLDNGNVAVIHLTSEFPILLDADLSRTPVPEDIHLSAFPNPFNPSTEITLTLPHSAHVTLSVFDLTGRIVSTLANQQMQSGSHHMTFDASELSSGIYFCRLNANHHALTRKLMLLR